MAEVSVRVCPEVAIFDEIVEICVEGLPPGAPVTVDAFIFSNKNGFIGYAQFYADEQGKVRVDKDRSVGGSFCGVHPMGLFTNMTCVISKHAAGRVIVRTADKPLKYEISAWKGHLDWNQLLRLHSFSEYHGTGEYMHGYYDKLYLATAPLQRTCLGPGVKRIVIGEAESGGKSVRGVLFVPPGPGPFPGIIDLFGGIGGCVEFRAALFARHGFVALALPYFNYKGLPFKTFTDFTMKYFDEAVDWMLGRPEVDRRIGGVGMCGVSLGAFVTLQSAVRNPRVRAAVMLNQAAIVHSHPNLHGNVLADIVHFKGDQTFSEGVLDYDHRGRNVRAAEDPPFLPEMFPLLTNKHDNPLLLLMGTHERSCHVKLIRDKLVEQWKRSGKKGFEWVEIEGQGHLIEPPYSVQCHESPQSATDPTTEKSAFRTSLLQEWGSGDRLTHAEGQVKSWNIILDFFKRNLVPEKAKL